MLDKMKQLMEMKRQADQIKKELDASEIISEEVKGIKIAINGSQEFKVVEIGDRHLRPENKKVFERDLLRSLNGAMRKSQEVAAQKMRSVLPGFPGL